MRQESLFNPEPKTQNQEPVECLGLTFPNDEDRRNYFLKKLCEGLEELHAKLGGVPFTTVEDAVARLKSLEKWPGGDDERIQELVERMAQAARHGVLGSQFRVQSYAEPGTRNQKPGTPAKLANQELLSLYKAEVGFPHGEIEDILNLSDPPYYTACPNPFISDFIRHWQAEKSAVPGSEFRVQGSENQEPKTRNQEPYQREPFAADVSEGKNDPIYNAHSYHTKVPHKAIMRYILHYTEPGDVVFDGFCGTGMTGVAAQLCGDRKAIESLGYTVSKDGTIHDKGGEPISKLGVRHAVLNDVSPAASFIAANYNLPVDISLFQKTARELLCRFGEEFGWMYETAHGSSESKGRINFTVWSDVFLCNHCQGEIVFWNVAVEKGTVKDTVHCPHCGAEISKSSLDRATTMVMDATVGKPVPKARQVPVLINYSVGGKKYEKEPDDCDLQLLERIERTPVGDWYPTRRIDEDIDLWYERDYRALGIYSIDAFFTRRNLIMTAWFRREIESISRKDARLGAFLWFWFESVLMGFSKLNRYLKNAFSQVNRILSGTLYVGAMQSEVSPWYALQGKISRFSVFERIKGAPTLVSTCSTAFSGIPDSSLDYIFVDPPFGSNIIYSDLSIMWESWLRLYTNTGAEAVVHRRKKRGAFSLNDYANMMAECFAEMYRALKPARWITVEFHNSRNSVWTAIQEALTRAGFVIADVRTLDKQMQTFKQVTAAGAVKQDLVISAYKPNGGLEKRFKLSAGTEDGVWDFVRTHLRQLPVAVVRGSEFGVSGSRKNQEPGTGNQKLEIVAERQNYLLFDRMVAFHVQRGVTVPLSAAEFYAGLAQRFPERDGMYFLPEQVAEYDKKRMKVKEVLQLQLFVTDEASAIQWLKQQLTRKPQTFQELHPQFLKEIGGWQKHEKPLELSELLEQNFLRYDSKGPIPAQIVSWMKQSADLRKIIQEELASGRATEENGQLRTQNQELITRAKARWYVPDPNKAGDLEKLRERALLREFEEYRESKQKRLKVFRLEAVRAGFKKAWQERDYATIIAVARKIPEKILQEDPKLLMWYDQAVTRLGDTETR